MTRLILALQLMTRLPLPQVRAEEKDFAAAIRWFPASGIVVGLAIAAALAIGIRTDPWLAALLGLIAWVAVTGALHLDGLGDIADGAGAAHGDRAKLSAVLTDPHIGSFGVVAIVLQLLAKLILLRLCAERFLRSSSSPCPSSPGSVRWHGPSGCRRSIRAWPANSGMALA